MLVEIAGMEMNPTVDTAADITIVSQKVYDSMKSKPHIVKETNTRPAGEGTGMRAHFLGEVEVTVGGYRFVHPIYVGPFQDEMLGIDFLRSHGA